MRLQRLCHNTVGEILGRNSKWEVDRDPICRRTEQWGCALVLLEPVLPASPQKYTRMIEITRRLEHTRMRRTAIKVIMLT